QQMKVFAGGLESLDCFSVIDPYGREGIKVQPENFVAADKLSRFDGVGEVHREVITDAERCESQFRALSNQLHVHGEGGVAGVVNISFAAFDYKSSRVATISAVRQAAGM